MASLIAAAGFLTYEKIRTAREKKRAKKAHNASRYSELEKDTMTEKGGRDECGVGESKGERTDRNARNARRRSASGSRGSSRGSSREDLSLTLTERERERGTGRERERGRRVAGEEEDAPPAYESITEDKGGRRFGFKGKGAGIGGDGIVR
ncbi:MAG: hypothetical protein M1830_003517 [Pleopsidium flavum]|nr:MAG: hypothetical protein M1830_003517 [Pleopsidium flavum]